MTAPTPPPPPASPAVSSAASLATSPAAPPGPALRSSSFSRYDLRARLETGELTRLRRDTYLRLPADAEHWQTALATWEALIARIREDEVDGVVALESAALLHGAATLGPPTRVDLIIGWNASGLHRRPTRREPDRESTWAMSRRDRRRVLSARTIVRHRLPLTDDDVVVIGGLRVTSLERTIEDCARFLEPDRALAVVDSLLAIATSAGPRPWDRRRQIDARAEAVRAVLLERLETRRGERGVRRARAVIGAASPWSQSPWESEARRLCLVNGIIGMVPQLPMRTAIGEFYADLGWPGVRLDLEVDGDIKYREDLEATLAAQARRQEALEAAGFVVIRFTPAQLRDSAGAVSRLRGYLAPDLCAGRVEAALRNRAERHALRSS